MHILFPFFFFPSKILDKTLFVDKTTRAIVSLVYWRTSGLPSSSCLTILILLLTAKFGVALVIASCWIIVHFAQFSQKLFLEIHMNL